MQIDRETVVRWVDEGWASGLHAREPLTERRFVMTATELQAIAQRAAEQERKACALVAHDAYQMLNHDLEGKDSEHQGKTLAGMQIAGSIYNSIRHRTQEQQA